MNKWTLYHTVIVAVGCNDHAGVSTGKKSYLYACKIIKPNFLSVRNPNLIATSDRHSYVWPEEQKTSLHRKYAPPCRHIHQTKSSYPHGNEECNKILRMQSSYSTKTQQTQCRISTYILECVGANYVDPCPLLENTLRVDAILTHKWKILAYEYFKTVLMSAWKNVRLT